MLQPPEGRDEFSAYLQVEHLPFLDELALPCREYIFHNLA